MQIYNVYQSGKRLYIDEKEIPDNKIVVNKYDNMQQTLRLISDGTLPTRLYWALRNPKLSNKYFILKLVNNEDLIVGTDISATPGLWDMLLIGTDEDYIIEGTDIDQSRLTYVSDHFGRLFVRDNFLEELDFEEQCSPTFKVFYDEIMFQLDNIPDLGDIPDKMSDLENDTNFISGVAFKDDGQGNVEIIGTTFSGGETEEGGGGNYNLPVANETTLGGVKPLNKTDDMIQEVGVDKDGRLFAKGKDITVDSEFSEESTNPVQNQVVTKEVIALRKRNAELEETIEKLQIKSTTDTQPFHHITDSANYRVLDFGMEGKTEQETVQGNQLFDLANSQGFVSTYTGLSTEIDLENNTLTTTNSHTTDRTGNLDLGVLEAGTYYLSFENVNSYITNPAIQYGELETGLTRITQINCRTGGSFTIEEEQHCWLVWVVKTDVSLKLANIMLNKGTTALPFEPYTGNQPSPNPDYPQEIELAGVLNEETGRYEHKCCVGNKNFFDKVHASVRSNWKQVAYHYYPIYVGKGNIVTISYQDTLSTGLGFYLLVTSNEAHKGTTNASWVYHSSSSGLIKKSVTITAESDYIYLNFTGDNDTGYQNMIDKLFAILQVEVGNVVTDLAPHASQPFTLTSDRPLTMWDKLVKRDGVWGWSVNSLHYVIDENTAMRVDTDRMGFTITSVLLPVKANRKEFYSNQFWYKDDYNASNLRRNSLYLGLNNTLMYLCNNDYFDSTLSDSGLSNWKAHLNENPLEIWTYADEEQSFHPLPDEEQTLLNNLETYHGVTNLYNDQGCPMWLTYVQSPQICMENVNKKIEEINSALLSLGANV